MDKNAIAQVSQTGYNDYAEIGIAWRPVTKQEMAMAGTHEGIHLGYYGTAIRKSPITPDYYKNVYLPEQ